MSKKVYIPWVDTISIYYYYIDREFEKSTELWKKGTCQTMKSTGIVRPIDNLGRIVIPTELRKPLHINDKDPLEIYVDGNRIILKKYQPSCIFCDRMENVTTYQGYNVCKNCMTKLGNVAKELFGDKADE